MMQYLLALAVLLTAPVVADIVVENDLIKPEEIFDFVFSEDSAAYSIDANVTKYYCVYRNLWTEERQPSKYPKLARVSDPVMYSSTKQFLPWLKNRATTYGVEKIAEAGFTDTFQQEIVQAGALVHNYGEGKGFFVDLEDNDKNFCYLDGITVNADFPYLSGMASVKPSPDWFTGFYLLNTVDEYDRTYWSRLRIETYPWDAGTDAGESYNDLDRDQDPPLNVARIFPQNTVNGIFLSPNGKDVPPIAEWECILYTCDEGVTADECVKPDWPPVNGCDVLKFPACVSYCDPAVDSPCNECIPKPVDVNATKVFYANCCDSNHEPSNGKCDVKGSHATRAFGAIVAVLLSVGTSSLFY